MLYTLPEVLQFDGFLSSVSPYNFACVFEAFFVVCEYDEVLEGCDGASGSTGSELEVGWGAGEGWSGCCRGGWAGPAWVMCVVVGHGERGNGMGGCQERGCIS